MKVMLSWMASVFLLLGLQMFGWIDESLFEYLLFGSIVGLVLGGIIAGELESRAHRKLLAEKMGASHPVNRP